MGHCMGDGVVRPPNRRWYCMYSVSDCNVCATRVFRRGHVAPEEQGWRLCGGRWTMVAFLARTWVAFLSVVFYHLIARRESGHFIGRHGLHHARTLEDASVDRY